MSMVRKTLKGSSFLSAAEVVNQACSMLRNIILARFLTKADFGIAALLGLILTLFEMTGKMAFGQQVIQSKKGDNPAYLDTVHFTQFTLGLASCLLITVSAWPLAHFVAGPQYLPAILLLGLVPLINGCNHLEVYQRTRQLSYGPMVLTDMLPQLITTLAAWPLAIFFKDYRAVLVLIIGRSVVYAIGTQIFAKNRFRLRYNRAWVIEGLKFGWPLLVAGFVQMGNFQGDSMVVAACYELSQLGEYSVALTMAMTPGFALLRVSHSIALPLLSEVHGDLVRLSQRFGCYVGIMSLLSCSATIGMLFLAEQVIVLFYGSKYAGIGSLAALLTAAQSMRIIRGATVGVAMAVGDTLNNLMANLWRLSGLLFAALVGWMHGSLAWFAITSFAGESIALVVTVIRLRRRHDIAPLLTLKPTVLAIISGVVAATARKLLPVAATSLWNWPIAIVAISCVIGVFLFSLSDLRVLFAEFSLKLNARFGCPLPASWWGIRDSS